MRDETWPWYALQTKQTQAMDQNQSVNCNNMWSVRLLKHAYMKTLTILIIQKYNIIKKNHWIKWLPPQMIIYILPFSSSGTAPDVFSRHLLLQRDDVFVARVLPCQTKRQVVGFRAEVQRSKGYFELLSHHKIHRWSHGYHQHVSHSLMFYFPLRGHILLLILARKWEFKA